MSNKTIHILLVEDDEAHVELISRAFESQAGLVALTVAYTLREAYDHLVTSNPDLIIADLRLPDGQGSDLLPPDRQDLSSPVVIMTSHGDEQVAVEAMKAGALDYVVKSDVTLAEMPHIAERALREWGHIIERNQAEEALRKSEEKFRSLINDVLDTSAVGMLAFDSDFRVVWVNQALEGYFGLRREDLIGQDVRQLLHDLLKMIFEDPERFAENMLITYNNSTSVEHFECHVLPKGEREERWLEHWSQPIRSGLYAEGRIEHYYDITERKQKVRLQQEIAERKQIEEMLRKTHDELEMRVKARTAELANAMEGTIQAMALTVEMRDPYTAGHQRRATQLTCAIARELGLSEERVEGIRLAGMIHDLGKIYVPAEILSKPGQLTDLEFSLIKNHAQVGYDILKTVTFPWPIAQIVLQHHERMDGFGYPQGLSGADILLEARILSVADVVEAMSSHRPYRPALGLEQALEEISQNRGTFYDPAVVDVCLRLFTKQGFTFE